MFICEVYIDDLVIPASSLSEGVDRLRRVLTRLREKSTVLSPKVCKFLLRKVEYLGQTTDEDGVYFSDDRVSSILEVELPKTYKQLKKFLGVVVYLSSNFDHYSERTWLLS